MGEDGCQVHHQNEFILKYGWVWRLNRWMESPKCDAEREDVLFQTLGDQQTSSALLESVPAAALRGRSNRVILSLIDIFLETQ